MSTNKEALEIEKIRIEIEEIRVRINKMITETTKVSKESTLYPLVVGSGATLAIVGIAKLYL